MKMLTKEPMHETRKRDFGATTRSVYDALLRNDARMGIFGIPARGENEYQWQIGVFETRLCHLLDGHDPAAAETILDALQRDHADITISRTWLDQLRRVHGGTDAGVLLYAAAIGKGIALNDIDGLGRGADIDISFIEGALLVEMWVGPHICLDSDGHVSFAGTPKSLHMALTGSTLSAIATDELLTPFVRPIAAVAEGYALGTVATLDMPDDRVALENLTPADVRPIRGTGEKHSQQTMKLER